MTVVKHINLFSEKKKAKKVDNRAFDTMTAVADKTDVNIIPTSRKEVDTKNIHRTLMAAGFSPAWGNVADVADAALYAIEGEFGEAGWSLASAIPVIGQMVAGKRALKLAKEAGAEMVTLYRGVEGVKDAKTMVKKGKFVGGINKGTYSEMAKTHPKLASRLLSKFENQIYVTPRKSMAEHFSKMRGSKGLVLEFEVPRKYLDEFSSYSFDSQMGKSTAEFLFEKGLPIEFLKKVHK